MKRFTSLLLLVFILMCNSLFATSWDFYNNPGTSNSGNWMAESWKVHGIPEYSEIVSPFF